jgi:hypothetical protein
MLSQTTIGKKNLTALKHENKNELFLSNHAFKRLIVQTKLFLFSPLRVTLELPSKKAESSLKG